MTELVLLGWFLQGGYNDAQFHSVSGGSDDKNSSTALLARVFRTRTTLVRSNLDDPTSKQPTSKRADIKTGRHRNGPITKRTNNESDRRTRLNAS